jgi:16S rRNA processing protein RimM
MALVGRIARPHGIRGQVIVNPETDFPDDRFQPGAALFVERGGVIDTLTITTARSQNGRPVLGIAGIETMTEAEALAGLELRVPIEWLPALADGTFYRHDLIGCRVETRSGEAVGVVQDVEGGLAGSRLLVTADAGGEIQIPLVSAFCPVIDTGAKRIVIDPPAGLLEVNR